MLKQQQPRWLPWLMACLLVIVQGQALGDEATTVNRRNQLLAQTLSESAAVELALINSRGIQAMMLEVGIRQSEVTQAGQWPNPGYSIGVTRQENERSVEQGFHFNLSKLLFKSELQAMAAQRVLQTQKQLAAQMLQLGHETRKAHVEAVAAQESVKYMQQVFDLSQASAALADKMKLAGNFTKLQQFREKTFASDALLGLNRAQRQANTAKERLGRLMGLEADQMHFKLPNTLPGLPQLWEDRSALEHQALQRRFDVQLAKLNTELTAKNLGLTKSSRFINVLEVGVSNKRSNLPATEQGLEIGFELPLFDTGEERLAKAQSQYFQSLHFAAEIALTAQSEVREAYANYKEAHAMALHHRDVVLPLHEAMAEEQLLRYNGMMIGVFELLAESRLQIASVNTYMILLKDFWLAQVDLDMAISGKSALSPTSELPTLASGSVTH